MLLCANYGKVLTVKTHEVLENKKINYKIVSCPERIRNEKKYERNEFIYNIGSVSFTKLRSTVDL